MISLGRCLVIFVLWISFAGSIGGQPPGDTPREDLARELPRIPPKEPHEAIKSFQVHGGFRMDLIAHEPAVTDPVASVIDENGRMFVVEMAGYPYPEKMEQEPIGKVRLLDDRDGDGIYESSTIFVDGLSWPTGIAVWKGGVYVTAAPDIWYFRDTDGDDRADVRRKVFTGFDRHNVQGLLNNPKWGLDHRIYVASASNGGSVGLAADPKAPRVSVRGSDFSFDPATERYEAVSGSAQFGNSFDDWGNRFVCSNSDHAQMIALESRYLSRNPYLAAPRVLVSIAAEGGAAPVFRTSAAEPWRIVRTRRRAATPDKYVATELVPIGFFTSASGITVYRGGAYPEEFFGNLFIGDVGGNLIHRKRLVPNGPLLSAVRADENTEFVTSTDNWFRPVNFTNAPDGTLHVLDMYRETIEHPASIPDDIKALLDLESGRDRGRVYRLTPPNYQPGSPPRLGKAGTDELVAALAHPNGWWRETAHRLIWERQDKAAVEPLRRLFESSPLAQGRLNALWSLEGLEALEDRDLSRALRDASAHVRRNAVLLAEKRLDRSDAVLAQVLALSADEDASVRLQVALSLGESKSAPAASGLAELAKRDGKDPWIRAAVLSASLPSAAAILTNLLAEQPSRGEPETRAVLRALASFVGAKRDNSGAEVVLAALGRADAADIPLEGAMIGGLLEGFGRGNVGLEELRKLLAAPARDRLDAALARARRIVGDDAASGEARRAGIELLASDPSEESLAALAELLHSRTSPELQRAALAALGKQLDPKIADRVLEQWKALTPGLRAEATEILLSRQAWIGRFLEQIAANAIPASQVPANRRPLLLGHADAMIRARAQELLGRDPTSPRAEVIERYRPALGATANLQRGAKIFERECAGCHKAGGKGQDVGPNLATIANRTAESLLTQILDPNREVLPNYLDYVVSTLDGRVFTGLIVGETATSLALRRAQGAETVLLRSEIDEIKSTGKSLMPEGLEKNIPAEEMADLVAFLLQANMGAGGPAAR